MYYLLHRNQLHVSALFTGHLRVDKKSSVSTDGVFVLNGKNRTQQIKSSINANVCCDIMSLIVVQSYKHFGRTLQLPPVLRSPLPWWQ